jgi:hypothetical protein
MTTKTQQVHINEIRSGDTVIHEDKTMTVCSHNIIKGGFMGTTLFGDSYMCGHRLVTKVIY